jgi:urease accessory protein
MKRRLLIALPGLLIAAPVLAHSGHGEGTGILAVLSHPFSGAEHLLGMLAVCLSAAWIRGRAMWALPLAFIATMVAGAALSLVGITWAFADPALTAAVMLAGVVLSRTGGVTAAGMATA